MRQLCPEPRNRDRYHVQCGWCGWHFCLPLAHEALVKAQGQEHMRFHMTMKETAGELVRADDPSAS